MRHSRAASVDIPPKNDYNKSVYIIADEDRDYIQEIRRIVDSYGDDEEKQKLCDA
jgi:hypothetical protein